MYVANIYMLASPKIWLASTIVDVKEWWKLIT